LILRFITSRREYKRLWTEWMKVFPEHDPSFMTSFRVCGVLPLPHPKKVHKRCLLC
jgi:hypothetical protein